MKDQKSFTVVGSDLESLYSRGVSGTSYNPDQCPSNGFTQNDQFRYTPWGGQGRPGTNTFTLFRVFAVIKQILPYSTNNPATGLSVTGYFVVEWLAGATNIYDSNATVPATPIYIAAGSYYMSFIVLFSRIAFTLHDFSKGFINSYQVYKPQSAASRDNGGNGPSLGGVNFASSGTAGIVTQGIHVFGLAYEYNTGHISALSTVTGIDVSFFTLANANQQVTITGMPLAAPTNVTKLHILASRLVANSSGNAPDYELFFVAERTAAQLVTDAGTYTFNFSDESLVDSADYLYDLFGSLYGQLGFTWYSGRLIGWGESYNSGFTVGPSCLRVSELEDPESFSISHGVVPVFQDDGDSGIKNVWEYKGLLIIQKESRTFVTRDNGDDPNTWQVDVLDGTIGGVLFGIAKTTNQVGAIRTDFTISVARNGVYLFDGKYAEIPITWKIERLWQQISEQTDYLTYQAIDIPTAKLLVFKVWSPSSEVHGTTPYLLVCDYSRGLSWQTVRWSRWFFTAKDPFWIAMNDRNNMLMVENVSNVVDNMIIGTSDTEINASFTDGILTTGDLNPDDELNYWHWQTIKLKGEFSTITACKWITDAGSVTILSPQTSVEFDITKIKINQNSYYPRFSIEWSESGSDKLRIRNIAYFRSVNATDLLGA